MSREMSERGPDSVSVMSVNEAERLVKSPERVRDLGEVFTPSATVQEMLDLIPETMWLPHPSATFLEPACGDGNFLVAILERKLAAIADSHANQTLSAGISADAVAFHVIEALASIYAVDISVDNVVGGTPGHEIGARERLVAQLKRRYEELLGVDLDDGDPLLLTAGWIVERNVQVGNMLAFNADGSSTGRDDIPLLVYQWGAESLTVSVERTTLGAVSAQVEMETSAMPSLFGPPDPEPVWSGRVTDLHQVVVPGSMSSEVPVANGVDRRGE